jgi:hypothetical protein
MMLVQAETVVGSINFFSLQISLWLFSFIYRNPYSNALFVTHVDKIGLEGVFPDYP